MQTKTENIPEELKKLNCWVCWDDDKLPKNPATGKNAQSNNPKTWGTFAQAVKACETFNLKGLGFVFDGKSGYFGVDLDKCLDKPDFVEEFIETLQSYNEISKSGNGIHIICKGELPKGGNRKDNVEMYNNGRYFICTGNVYNANYTEIKDCTEPIKILHSQYIPSEQPATAPRKKAVVSLDDRDLIEKVTQSKNGTYFHLLMQGDWQGGGYKSQSEADLAFCSYLAFWTGRNQAQMDRIFRSSGLMRKKWDEKRGGDTYGNITILKACAACVDVYDPEEYPVIEDIAIKFFGDGKVKGVSTKEYDMTDTGNAHRLQDEFNGEYRFSFNRKKWYFWTGAKWLEDVTGQIKRTADDVCDKMKYDAVSIDDDEQRKASIKWARRTANSAAKEAMIKECQHLEGVPVLPEEFDKYKDLYCCQNGIINLKNGELMPFDKDLMLTKQALCDYDVEHKPPVKWLQFLDDITDGDLDLIDYIHRCIGYSLSGDSSEQCAFFLYGMGRNGKSTFTDVIRILSGDYGATAQAEVVMLDNKYATAGSANPTIARLKGVRFLALEEPKEGTKLNESLIKQLTGGTPIVCRHLYCEEFEYEPEFKIWMCTNHKPIIRGTDLGIWRRIKLIPFEVTIDEERVDPNLKYKLRDEMPQILAWAVEGCIKWREEGLNTPKRVLEEINEYKTEMDLIASFLEQCIVIDYSTDSGIMANDLFNLYTTWAKVNNEYTMSNRKFGLEIIKKLPERHRVAQGNIYTKIVMTDYAQQLIGRSYKAEDFK